MQYFHQLTHNKLAKVSVVITAAVFALAACQSSIETTAHSAVQALAKAPQQIFQHDKLNGQKVIQLNQDTWVANSENFGLMLINQQGKMVQNYAGNFESLDIRQLDNKTWFVSSVDKEAGQFLLFKVVLAANAQTHKITLLNTIKPEASVIDNQCLAYQNGQLSSFWLTAQQQVEQRIVYLNQPNAQPSNVLVRSFSAPPGASACVVDDVKQQVYVAEESAGVWAYPTNPEKELSRTPIALVAPFGQIDGEIKDISLLIDGSLLVALPEAEQIQHYQTDNSSHLAQVYSVAGFTIESIDAQQTADNKWLANFYDDESGAYYSIELPLMVADKSIAKQGASQLTADMQTAPVARFGDAADDPEVWLNPNNGADSLILTTDKRYGLNVYNLAGELVETIASGRINNIDISYGAEFNGDKFDFATASNRTYNSITMYKISHTGVISELANLPTSLPDVYGLCQYQSPITGDYFVFINDESGIYHQYQLDFSTNQVTGKLVREFKVASQPEGCVADAQTQTLYLGEEDWGIWTIGAEPDAGTRLAPFYQVDGDVLVDDVEGLSLYLPNKSAAKNRSEKYLVASSQGDDSYVVFDLAKNASRGHVVAKFNIVADVQKGIDGASETDGLAVIAAPLGDLYPLGALVVQDGRNIMPVQPQNFKLVDWRKISGLIIKQ
ncbi:phytase domain-containing protein [Catenovulum agarivorans DS-2]|uniref:Phytase domain-containing protein n=1 Tax=Catenovulum agarivorans DS-2 TaxID=1328313 RepID=W7QN70_9ALTE|nr:phytase [Catenovulum agarivorans]EWH09343.1 phytase domain-containing protein [Catenovulum agarivorans DS-2]